MNILQKANNIVNVNTDKTEQYGTYHECNQRIADIMTVLCGKQVTVEDVFKLEIAMKLAREVQNHKEENLLDTVAYIGALNNELNDNSHSK